MESLDTLEQEIYHLIADRCNVLDPPETMSSDAPILGNASPLELDSLDAVEIVAAIEKNYQVRINNADTSRVVLTSLRTLANFVREKQVQDPKPLVKHGDIESG